LRILSVILQTILLWGANVFVIFVLPFLYQHKPFVQTVLSHSSDGTHVFVWDGLLATLAVYVLILLIELLSKRLMRWSGMTTLALVIAILLGFRFGFTTI
jgi:hypothetical protein